MFLHAAKLQIKILKRWLSSKKLIEIPIEVTTNWTQDSEKRGGGGVIFHRTIFIVVLSVSRRFGRNKTGGQTYLMEINFKKYGLEVDTNEWWAFSDFYHHPWDKNTRLDQWLSRHQQSSSPQVFSYDCHEIPEQKRRDEIRHSFSTSL